MVWSVAAKIELVFAILVNLRYSIDELLNVFSYLFLKCHINYFQLLVGTEIDMTEIVKLGLPGKVLKSFADAIMIVVFDKNVCYLICSKIPHK